MIKKNKKSILKEIKEFLEYLAKADEDSRKEESLKKKFGEEEYKTIYDLIGGKYTGALPKKEGKKKYLVLYIRDNGLRFLEEQKREKLQQNQINAQNFLTFGILSFTIFYGLITLIFYYFNLKYVVKHGSTQIILIGLVLLLIIAIVIIKIRPKNTL